MTDGRDTQDETSDSMTATVRRRQWWLLVLAAVAVGTAARAAFLWWSPLPATLDGFAYARHAADMLATATVRVDGVAADELVMTTLLATASELTGIDPLYLAQPLVACIGGMSVVSAVVLVRGLGRDLGWTTRRTYYTAVVAALGLAVSGMYLRRTGVPDEEAIGLLLLPLFTLAAARVIATRRAAWLMVFTVLTAIYPPLHNLSSLVAAFTLTALATIHVLRARMLRDVMVPVGLTLGVWTYVFGFYGVAELVGLQLTYSGLISEHVGAFLAWLVVLVVGVLWLRSTSRRAIRTLFAVGIGAGFLAAGANLVTPVFPGTIETPPLILGLVALYVVPVALFAWWLPTIVREQGDAAVAVALLLGPVALGWFTFSTSLTPEFFDAVLRVQVHAHIAAFVLAAAGAVSLASRRKPAGRVVVTALVVATVLSAPFAFVHIDTGTAPRTVHASEFDAVSFAVTGGQYAADHRLARVGSLYFDVPVSGSTGETYQWLGGGEPPDCLTLAQRTWTDAGAHFYPRPPRTLADARLDSYLASNSVVYSSGGVTETYGVLPRGESRTGC